MFNQILLATDGSACALKAAGLAAGIAAKFASRLTLVTVYAPMPIAALYGEPPIAALDGDCLDDLQNDILCRTARVVDDAGCAYTTRREFGQPAGEITRLAAEVGCDLIVLGSRGLSGFKAFLLGSVSESVAHNAHCPVLIVK